MTTPTSSSWGGDSLLITFLTRQLDQRLGVRVPAWAMLARHEASSVSREPVWES
ncbi:hypothetical protein [Streptomyces sp. 3214.6]|uniref:hypothetical protein n=1 Tax=Streptomyces sp. 3214.6 TaxID=1882757 RepID=UPI003FA7DEE6